MKVLIVGGGGREHAIALKIKENPEVTALYAAPGNGGIAQIATCLPFKATDVDGIVRWAAENKVDFVIVAPDAPNFASFIMDATASTALSRSGQMSTPLPSARPSALTTMGISAVCKYLTAAS